MDHAAPNGKPGVRFLPDGRAPTFKDIEHLAIFNAIAKQCLAMWKANDLTRDEAIMGMALALADQNNALMEQLLETTLKQRTVFLTTRD